MKVFYILAFLFITGKAFSQDFEITGKVVDEIGVPLESATIYLEKAADSSLVTYTISEKNGNFRLTGTTTAPKANLYISFAGYQSHRETLEIKEQIELPTIALNIQDNELEEVMVTATRAPITIKKDTLEFNAGSFSTRQDANLEELMKKLPGVEVDNQGNITVNGRPVSRILVNGEEFFGDDPKIATKNLPKEIIDKIQVTDTKTRSEEFTGKPGDPENKTVNITIKEDKNKGYFARATAGGGTDDRYELSGIGNYFKDDLRLSVLASSNNINTSGFSYDEVFGMMGRTAGRNVFGGGGGGITKAETAGFNFVNKWEEEKEIELSADYFFGRNDTERRTIVARENILPDSRFFTNSEESSNLLNDSHRANVRFEVEFDTLTRLNINPRFNANFGNSYRDRIAESLDEDLNLINSTTSSNNEELESADFSNDIDFIKRFGSRGSYLQMEFENDHSRQKNDNFYFSESFFIEDGEEVVEIQDQYIDEDETENEYSFEVSKRSVLFDDFFLDISYDFDYLKSTNKRYVYEAENGDGDYNTLNDLLSSDFEVNSRRHTPNVGLNYEGDVWRINTEVGLLHTSLDNTNFLEETSFENTYNNLFLDAGVRYEIERSKSLSIDYSTNVDIPSIRQLQPVVDRTNPLNIIVGNPELKPTYRQDIRLNYRNFDFATRSGIFSYANIGFSDNNVVPVTTVDEDLVRRTTYTNVDGAINGNVGLFYNKQYKKEARIFSYQAGLNSNYNKNIGFTNAVRYEAERYSISPRLRLTYEIEELLSIEPNYELTYNNTMYDINPDRNEDFINHSIGLQTTTYWPENVVFGNDISFNYFGNVSPGFDNTSLLWNMSLGYEFLKDKATLKVKVYDLLDQNIDTRRVIGDDYIQDTSSLILTRYAMLSFTYKLSNFGGSGPPDRGGRRF
ncbi:outer membrane beta-barrel protein [Zunongwangia sp. F260]|uniref:Outer membrane beta-barrel protein n=1 Tax=Autumnicola lenta TaxID=3075593 RepID=A0ABU3CHN6_9FLAO|nr:outer membrane beta-barrel protein [Zunongwangia sp. F260]MDT0645861.1 outer membrane beta-barrel protein [Zunongwangia sp. F260]